MKAKIVAQDQRVNQIPLELETAKENARRFKLSPFTIRRLGYAGAIKEFRCGRAVRYSPEEILRWMESQGRGQR